MATVRDLIEQLRELKDHDQPIIYQYYLAEHFEFNDKDEAYSPTEDQFAQAAEDLDDDELWHDALETINDYLYGLISKEEEN